MIFRHHLEEAFNVYEVIEEVVYINEKASQTYAKRVCMKMISHVYKSLSQCLKKFLIVQKKV